MAAAFGAEPMPASLENMPRRTPCITIVMPTAAPATSRRPKAWPTISAIMPGTSVMLTTITIRARKM